MMGWRANTNVNDSNPGGWLWKVIVAFQPSFSRIKGFIEFGEGESLPQQRGVESRIEEIHGKAQWSSWKCSCKR